MIVINAFLILLDIAAFIAIGLICLFVALMALRIAFHIVAVIADGTWMLLGGKSFYLKVYGEKAGEFRGVPGRVESRSHQR